MKKIKYLAIIPARKGSKGLPQKNKIKLGDKPLIEWTIQSAINSTRVSEIFISTDDEEIIELSKKYNVNLPFKRPSSLANDNSNISDVIMHVLNYYDQNRIDVSNIVLLQPTTPFRTSQDIDNAIFEYEKSNAKRLISVSEPIQHPYDFIYIENGKMRFLNSENLVGRQAYKKFYFVDGGIYISEKKSFYKTKTFLLSDTKMYIVNKSHSFDIDNEFDFKLGQAWLKFNKK